MLTDARPSTRDRHFSISDPSEPASLLASLQPLFTALFQWNTHQGAG